MQNSFDVVIIGGGAAGMCAAINIKRKNKDISVAVFEQLPRIGKKLILTGNGRCNITNSDQSLSRFHGENPLFAQFALKKYDNVAIEAFFEELGITFFYDETGRAYPYSLQASSVVDTFRFAAENLGVLVFCEQTVSDIKVLKDKFLVSTNTDEFKAQFVVVATGLYSGGERIGSDGAVYRLLCKKGYKSVKTTPAIVQLRGNADCLRSLKGIKVNATATLYCDSKEIRSEYGEVLFCDYGLSGPAIMQIARDVERTNGNKTVSLDLMSEYTFQQLYDSLCKRKQNLRYRNLEEFFTGLLNKRVGQAVIKNCALKLSQSVGELKEADIKRLTGEIKSMKFSVSSTTGFVNSQVTAGGLSTEQFNCETMMSEKDKNLFCIGEILDIDGDCGGFNLHWCWSSAMCASDAIVGICGENK